MKKRIILYQLLAAAITFSLLHPAPLLAAEKTKEDLPAYQLDALLVAANRAKYDETVIRTGGDVNIITTKDIEAHHYSTVAEAIKKIPGVQVASTGYHGAEYGTPYDADTVTINGDRRVVILIDGRRIDNDASTFNVYDRTKSDLNNVTNIKNIERIEVIKGPSTLAYGSDATGGVINIITKRGGKTETTIDEAYGSWGKQITNITSSGSSNDFNWVVNVGRERSGKTEYKDAALGKVVDFYNTEYNDENTSIRLDKTFDKDHSLSLYYSHINGIDHYPITAPDYVHPTPIPPDYNGPWDGLFLLPGYRNEWWVDDKKNLDLTSNTAHTTKRSNDYDAVYTFSRKDNVESFLRIFSNNRENDTVWSKNSYYENRETATSVQLQGGMKINKNDILLAGISFKQSEFTGTSNSYNDKNKKFTKKNTDKDRDSFSFFVQDKMKVSDKFTVTPTLRFDSHSGGSQTVTATTNGAVTSVKNKELIEKSSHLTKGIFTNYAFDDKTNLYASWSEVYNPVLGEDEAAKAGKEPLKPDEGNVYTIGLSRQFTKNTNININYVHTNMSNTVGRYSLWNDTSKSWEPKTINTWQKKNAFNIALGHTFDATWSMTASFAWSNNNQKAAEDPGDYWYDALFNQMRPTNKYALELTYQKNKWGANLGAEIFTGNDTKYFSDNDFVILGMNLNYQASKNTSLYLKLDNLTNQAYETKSSPFYGPGSFPMPSRSFMLGIKQTF